MDERVAEIRTILCNTILTNVNPEEITATFPLAGNTLDSMAVMRLILALEEHYSVVFEEDELDVEAFENLASLTALVSRKLDSVYA